MAQKMFVSLVDDIDGTAADETVEFGLDGVAYEIDLSDVNAADLREELGRYVQKGRRVGGRKRRAGGRGASGESLAEKRERNHKIRNWARSNGFPELAGHGRIPAEVLAAYEKRYAEPSEQPAAMKVVAAGKRPRAPRKAGAK